MDASVANAGAGRIILNTSLLVRTGSAALESGPSFRPEVVLCDIGLPGIDGYEVARETSRFAAIQWYYDVRTNRIYAQ